MKMMRPLFEGALCLGAILAVVGGATVGLLHMVSPGLGCLPQLETGYRQLVFGFLFCALFAAAAALLEALARGGKAVEEVPRPRPADARQPAAARQTAPAAPELAALYHEMKTFVDLEMWELALEKANAIIKNFPGTREAEIVSKNINEIRWKAEPKFVAQQSPLTADQEKELREKGLAEMYRHVRTYMDLEMWELARQKALAIMKSFPESAEAIELMKIYDTIDKKAREAPPPPKPEESDIAVE